MKRYYKFFVWLVFSLPAILLAQDWKSINSQGENIFLSGGMFPASRAIRIDSSFSLDGRTYFQNFYTLRYTGGECWTPYGASWIGREVIVDTSGIDLFFNFEGDTLRINTLAAVGQSWVFYKNPTMNLEIRAGILSGSVDTVLGIPDSVKVITFQAYDTVGIVRYHEINNLQLVLSKHYGLIQLFELYFTPRLTYYSAETLYNLAGRSDPQAGVKNIGFKEVYDFEIGDEFHTLADHYYTSGSSWDTTQTISTVIGKTTYNTDSVTYTYQRIWRSKVFVGPDYYSTSSQQDTIEQTIVFSSHNAMEYDKLPGESMIMDAGDWSYILLTNLTYTSAFNYHIIKHDPGSAVTYYALWGDSCYLRGNGGVGSTVCNSYYIEGCGGPYSSCYGYHYESDYKLKYFKKGTETWGTPYRTDVLLAVADNGICSDQIIVSPNPACDIITFRLPASEGSNYKLQIYSTLGVKKAEISLRDNETTMDVSNFHRGIYIFKLIKDSKFVSSGKFIKK